MKRYCGRATVEVRYDDRQGWECYTCFVSVKGSGGSRGTSIHWCTFKGPPGSWDKEKLPEKALDLSIHTMEDDDKREFLQKALERNPDGTFIIRKK